VVIPILDLNLNFIAKFVVVGGHTKIDSGAILV
jgi:hypothetical protein